MADIKASQEPLNSPLKKSIRAFFNLGNCDNKWPQASHSQRFFKSLTMWKTSCFP